MAKFEIGTTVVLKSGGPLMTVQGYGKILNPSTFEWEEKSDEVKCSWFEGEKKCSDVFHPDSLVESEIE